MIDFEKVIETAEVKCKEQGGRFTLKRKRIFSKLITADKALSPYELADSYHNEFGTKMPVMSIYRILDFLESMKLAHKINSINKYLACSHILCSHQHNTPQFLICRNCQKCDELYLKKPLLSELQSEVQSSGFQLTTSYTEISCLCNECSSKVFLGK
ncbi:MAG: transcriptional repressor [Lentisphaeraceae bacterium]|nr:transcriptional repressor [Lentisphaeraceae bacterium]